VCRSSHLKCLGSCAFLTVDNRQKRLFVHRAAGQVISGSWDKTVRCWDARSSSVAGTYEQPAQVMCMSLIGQHLVVATKRHHVMVYDIRKMSEAERSSETPTRFPTRSVRCFPDGTGTPVQYVLVFFLKILLL